ncbi:pilus assembly protein [Photobacterium proteolyticum]|uniref:Cyclic diguanosine monophosphate-binding protein n=2 Tax=Photobacterium TaxID=657 RepID=A0A1Q9GX87_9GAMM|nr:MULTISPECIES: PilZ domain-containing protein [Photobacterium]NBI52366.1 PilZ domain-containing protein [Photobacterium alginatilyticum]OLQ79875.1 pilus assembly protein [Photobacterium proteolyticum]
MAERRHFIRILYRTPAKLQQAQEQWSAEVRDLSLQGILLTCPPDWTPRPEENYCISFCLHDCDIELKMDTRLVHHDSDYLRMQILHIDIESASHLKRLVELNIGTDELLHRELEQLADLKKHLNE